MDNSQTTLLLVDDDPVNLEIMEEHLEEAGYHTVTAEQGEEAWNILEQGTHSFQAVLLDRMMPVMDGMEVLAKIKSHASLSMLPIIMQSAATSSDEIRQGIEAGAFYYLTKPYTKEVLISIVEAVVRDFIMYQSIQSELDKQSKIFQAFTPSRRGRVRKPGTSWNRAHTPFRLCCWIG